jgi:hypothetical protein
VLAILSSPDPSVTVKATEVMLEIKGKAVPAHHMFTQVNPELPGAAHLPMDETRWRRGDTCRELRRLRRLARPEVHFPTGHAD